MSSSIAIPRRKNPAPTHQQHRRRRNHHRASSIDNGMSGSSPSPSSSSSPGFPSPSEYDQTGAESPVAAVMAAAGGQGQGRRESLLSSSLSRSEHIVVNVGHPDAPRLITCVKASQGFDWNQDIFLPSYCDHDASDLERRQDPVQDIILTDEEAAEIFPQ